MSHFSLQNIFFLGEYFPNNQKKFTIKLKSKQEEFNSLIKKPDPQSVDFSDKYDDEPQNLDVLMNQSLSDREQQLKLIQLMVLLIKG